MRKRKFLIGLGMALVALLATAIVADAVTQRTYLQKFSATRTGPSVTKTNAAAPTYFEEKSSDPANYNPNAPNGARDGNRQPKLDEYVEVVFPKGSAIEQRTAASCRATNQEIFSNPPITGADGRVAEDFACKKGSAIGAGNASVRFPFHNSNDAKGRITVLNCYNECFRQPSPPVAGTRQVILYVNVTGANPIILRGNVMGEKNKTQKIRVPIPINCLLGTPPDCKNSQGVSNGDARISALNLTVRKITKRIKINGQLKRRAFIRTPKTCPEDRTWIFKIIFAGRDGTDQKYESPVACVPPSKN